MTKPLEQVIGAFDMCSNNEDYRKCVACPYYKDKQCEDSLRKDILTYLNICKDEGFIEPGVRQIKRSSWCKTTAEIKEKEDEYIYTSEAASMMNCTEMLIRKYCQDGIIKAHKNKNDKTGRWLISKKDLIRIKQTEKFPAFTRPRRK